ncbi:MAG TPA: DUF72 domain-containing protein [Clostridia bacterium]|nr:DUF72 domain-containing protein [Clostridia bacterium]
MTEPQQQNAPKVLVGTAGWSYKDWEGIVYPASLKKAQHPVEYLAQYFDVIEINTSFYGHIKPELGLLWCRKAKAVNPGFMFTAKLNKAFTHSPIAVVQATSAATIRPTDDDEKLAKEGLDALCSEGMLGGLLAQFPISFKNTNENRDYLENVLWRFRQYPTVVEVRHSSWNNEGTLRYFGQKGVAFCNIDQPVLGKSIAPTEHVTAPLAYVRLHGRNYEEWFSDRGDTASQGRSTQRRDERYNYLYSEHELRSWKRHIDNIAKRAQITFVVTNNHFEGKAAVNALQLKHMITERAVKVPETLMKHYWELEQISDEASARLL